MSILAQQDIRNSRSITTMNENVQRWVRWQENLGLHRPRPETTGYGGYTYSPPGLQVELASTNPANYEGPIGNDIADSDGQYGPSGFARLANRGDGSNNASSLLGAFGIMVNEGSDWGEATSSQNMKTTFTSGKQATSLRNASLGVADTPIASGGTVQGYEFDNKYGITNYSQHLAEDAQETTDTVPIEHTGLRNIPDMA